jgi:hypothetical protein
VVDTKALLKGFGAAADVAGQIATDKAINSRRVRSNFSQFDITNGQLVSATLLGTGDPLSSPSIISHGLGRVPSGVIILQPNPGGAECEAMDATSLTIAGTLQSTVTLWVV